MNSEIKETELVDVNTPGFKVEAEAPLVKVENNDSALNQSTQQLKQVWEQFKGFLSDLPEYLSEFFGEYKRPLTVLGLIFASVVSVKLTLALLDALNDIPLLAPTFELIGFGYVVWFVYRYLWRAKNRNELVQDFNNLKDEVLGKGNSQ
ncbi:CAAD domain-containing protein [Leptothermofonsia sichuanensis E412]|uniref:CAAD domain-containing protein n=1 Tax=Leptothermofonsia sichuanensis TaxID=2917832 RepID=UPI001CA5FB83|nr:CAAD domain-containing protein [Leptothermofonsia sichuanensis]QZZ22959.1 CAAD domain-containing protein [Leptothermofonsia sichuanensis E412]